MDALGPLRNEWPAGSPAFPGEFGPVVRRWPWYAGRPGGLQHPWMVVEPVRGRLPGPIFTRGDPTSMQAVAETSRRQAVTRAARELHCGVKPSEAVLVGDGRAVPAGFGAATFTPSGSGWDSGAVCLTANGGWVARPAEMLANG
jgi:hypothetical protein